ncbi:hypothetical protein [Streptomyces inusitatus]|uniref:hypothetical protein n=1 Tax=Streptomyces inusitatus TaxID=68221 RepID=UPI003570B4AE
MIVALLGCGPGPRGDGEYEATRARELVNLGDRITEYAKRPGAREPYRPPGEARRERLARGTGLLLDGDTKAAEQLLKSAGFRITRLTDTASGRRYDEIAALDPGRGARWGRLYLSAGSGIRWNVQVPHPVSDRDTESLGARLLESAPGGALVLAGAHRDAGRNGSADVAHRTDSVFHTIVAELQKRGVPGVQLHGFAERSTRPYEAVISTGAVRTAPEEAAALADRLESRGLRVCRGWSGRCPLEGIANVQGEAAERHRATFVHVELAPAARGDGREAATALAALTRLLTTWSRHPVSG